MIVGRGFPDLVINHFLESMRTRNAVERDYPQQLEY